MSSKFQKASEMETYYSNQASQSMLHFSGHYIPKGSGFGALADSIGRNALPLARKFIWPAAKILGRELLEQGAIELVELATKKKSVKQSFKSTVAKTARKQIDGSLQPRIRRVGKLLDVGDNSLLNLEAKKNFHFKKSVLKNHSQERVDWIFSRQ